ncbi:ABC transporter substrate-binding protein [Anditalea andensis]|uniref:Iron ABC transporter substrate-binding protein n=1 Tax=Anditalea andensis TaxID=1048983 RepID=A0A074LKS3_9BACT|nr:ABC transporter substrate-binding protein [Anditalea andensis]KEO74442.1 iron ABC transporter substrate-binding protein [Anditalea andensis]
MSEKSFLSFFLIPVILILMVTSCSAPREEEIGIELQEILMDHAKGFKIYQGAGYQIIEVTQAFPGNHRPFRYLILNDIQADLPEQMYDATILLPAETIIVTSTTHIPHLDLLHASDKLIGFPNLDLISSEQTRKLIQQHRIRDLGRGAQTNIELIIDLQPDWVMISTLGEDLKNLDLLQAAGISAVINGEYVEQNPLGRAEWIKFTGALMGKFEEANIIFKEIEKEYLAAENLAKKIKQDERPTVMAGVMYKDVWYVPGADSWGARLLHAAGGNYIFDAQKGTGSIQLNYEFVLDEAQDADYWLGASDFQSLSAMGTADRRYADFKAFQIGNVYSYTSKKGETGGIEYFELGYMRPDWILKDLIKILHPDLLPEYEPYFYSRLDD